MYDKDGKTRAKIWIAQFLASWGAMTLAVLIGAIVWVLWDILGLP